MAKTSQKSNKEIGSAFDLLGKSYEIVKKNWPAFVVVNIFSIVSSVLMGLKISIFDNSSIDPYNIDWASYIEIGDSMALGVFVVAISVVVVILFLLALAVLQVRVSAGLTPTISQIFNDAIKFGLRLIGLFVLSSIIITIGAILFIIPGFIAIGLLALSPYILIDKDVGVIEAMKRSYALGKAHFWKVWGALGVLILVAIGTNFISYFPVIGPIVGTLVSIAFSLVIVLRYRELNALKSTSK